MFNVFTLVWLTSLGTDCRISSSLHFRAFIKFLMVLIYHSALLCLGLLPGYAQKKGEASHMGYDVFCHLIRKKNFRSMSVKLHFSSFILTNDITVQLL